MKKTVLILLVLVTITGCGMRKNSLYLPDAENDKHYTTIGINEKEHQGEGYTIMVPDKNYRYEKDYDDGILEEKWDYTKKDDVDVKVTIYRNSDEQTARGRFLRDNDDYIFEDLTGYSVCGTERDGDVLWFNLHEADGTVYIVSWEHPKNTKEDLKKELADIAGSFTLSAPAIKEKTQ